MSIASEIQRLQQAKADIKAAINAQRGISAVTTETVDDYADLIRGIPVSPVLEVGATTVRTSASATANVASNDRIRIHGSDGKAYTIAEWNAMWVANGYSRTGMPTPDGFVVTKRNGKNEVIYFKSWDGNTYTIQGGMKHSDALHHSMYNTLSCITATASGSDSVTGKAWSITSVTDTDGTLEDERGEIMSEYWGLPAGTKYWALYTANTKSTFFIPQGVPYIKALADIEDFETRTKSLYWICEWYRHRFAVATGVTTEMENGTYREVSILNDSLNPPAVGEDMYFVIYDDNNDEHKCGLAKYNLCNLHGGGTASGLTAARQTTIYDGQVHVGINMNDSGMNSESKPLLCEGAKGAEAIAVDGQWYIITPYITYATNSACITDAPAVYFVMKNGWSLPSQDAIEVWYFNKTVVDALRTYLVSTEGWTIPELKNGTVWCAGRTSVSYALQVNTLSGYRDNSATFNMSYVVGASGL